MFAWATGTVPALWQYVLQNWNCMHCSQSVLRYFTSFIFLDKLSWSC